VGKKKEKFIDYISTCNLDAFFSPDFSTYLPSRRHWIRQQTTAEKAYENELLQRTDLNDTDLETMIEDLRAHHVQLRLAGLQKLQQSKPADFGQTLTDNPSLKYSCTFTPQQDELFTISGTRTCNVVNQNNVFTNPRLKPTTVNGVAVNNTCYISLPADNVDTDTRRAVLADVNEILEAVGEKADAYTLKLINDLKASIEELKKQTEEIKTVTIPNSRKKEDAKKKEYITAANDYKMVSYEMSDENPNNIYSKYYSLLRS
jgi:hypothetical protein